MRARLIISVGIHPLKKYSEREAIGRMKIDLARLHCMVLHYFVITGDIRLKLTGMSLPAHHGTSVPVLSAPGRSTSIVDVMKTTHLDLVN